MHHGMDGMGHGNSSGTGAASAADHLDLMAEPGVDFKRFDPALAPAEDSDGPVTHKVTLEVTEEVEEVAPGIEQTVRSEEHTSELQSRGHLVCRLPLDIK